MMQQNAERYLPFMRTIEYCLFDYLSANWSVFLVFCA